MGINSKRNQGGKNIFDSAPNFNNISIGKVVSVEDKYDGNRIKVRIKGIDDKFNDGDLPYAFPLLPKFINIVPSIGESVFVFRTDKNNKFDNRMWLGPIISQPQKLKFDSHFFSSTSLLSEGIIDPEQAPSTLPNAKGVYPEKTEIAFQGRDNTDLIFKPREILLRAGKFNIGNNLQFNKTDMGYIQIKHNTTIDFENDIKGSVTNIVSNKINLLSHNGTPRFNLDDQEDMITEEELEKILEKAEPAVFGYVILELLKLIKSFVINHTHYYHGLPPVKDNNVLDITNFDYNRIISKNIRIN